MNSGIYDMDLFDRIAVSSCMGAIRVPGGWVFESYADDGGIASSFVPFAQQCRTEFPAPTQPSEAAKCSDEDIAKLKELMFNASKHIWLLYPALAEELEEAAK